MTVLTDGVDRVIADLELIATRRERARIRAVLNTLPANSDELDFVVRIHDAITPVATPERGPEVERAAGRATRAPDPLSAAAVSALSDRSG